MSLRERLYQPMADGAVRLDPLTEAHRDGLRAACAADTEIWSIFPSNMVGADFDPAFDTLKTHPNRAVYAIVTGGAVVGMTSYLNAVPDRQTVEIGGTFIAPDVRGTDLNRRVKALLLDHAFASGVRRVEFRIDERNGRSQAAVRKLGATKEGVLRAERVTWTGHVRDTAIFGLLAEEWKARA